MINVKQFQKFTRTVFSGFLSFAHFIEHPSNDVIVKAYRSEQSHHDKEESLHKAMLLQSRRIL